MPIVTKEEVIMSTKSLFALLSVLVIIVGCKTFDWNREPNVITPPPYWQTQSQQNELTEMRAFHERRSAEMSEGVNVFRNREMERMAITGREMDGEMKKKQPPSPQGKAMTTPEKRERWSWANWMSRFR